MLDYIILGIVQGLTEFLPISSSGHLVIVQRILGIQAHQLSLFIVLHLGTVCAVVLFFFKDVIKVLRNMKSLLFVAVVTAITGIIGILGKDFFELLFNSVKLVAIALIVTGLVLILTKKYSNNKRDILDIKDAVTLGVAQAIAIIPGISRSGITISSLLFRKIDKKICFTFSFVAAIPAILGATLIEAREINFALQTDLLNFFVGFISSFLSGILALAVLKVVVLKSKLHYFGYYCILLAIITLLFMK